MATDKITIKGAREHNLKNVSLEIPRNQLVVFTGVSGSGKSSLVNDLIWPIAAKKLNRSFIKTPVNFDKVEGLEFLDKVILVGGSTRIPCVQELIKKELSK